MRSLIALAIMCLVAGTACRAQELDSTRREDCQVLLSEADNNFAAGKFYGIPSLLQGCIDINAFSNEENVRVYMLLTQSYLLSDDPASAEQSYLKLLAADPEYVADESVDPIEIVYLSKKFTTTPIFTPHFKVGPNFTPQVVIHEVNTHSTPVSQDLRGQFGLTIGGGIEWNINDNLGIGGEALVSYKGFKMRYEGMFGYDALTVRESQLWADFPFYVRYGYHVGKVRPFGYAGYSINLLFSDRLQQMEYENSTEESGEVVPVPPTADRSVMYKRQMLNGSLVFGGGIKYKWGKNFLLLDLRYMAGLTDMVKEENNYYSDEGSYELDPAFGRYGFIGDTFRVDNYSLTVGFVRPLYDPRKVSRVKTRGVSKKISGE
jgi:hypothetical protein